MRFSGRHRTRSPLLRVQATLATLSLLCGAARSLAGLRPFPAPDLGCEFETDLPAFSLSGFPGLRMKRDPARPFYASVSRWERGRPRPLWIRGFGNLWTRDPSYDLTHPGARVRVTMEARLTRFDRADGKSEGAEAMLGFSANRESWNTGTSDALSVRIGCDPRDGFQAALRSGMYARFHATSRERVGPGQWFRLSVELTAERLVASLDDRAILRQDLAEVPFPRKGYVGILGYRDVPWEVRSFWITQGGEEPASAPEGEPPVPAGPEDPPSDRGWFGR